MTCVCLNLPVERAFPALGAKASDPTRNRDVTKAVNFIVDIFVFVENLKWSQTRWDEWMKIRAKKYTACRRWRALERANGRRSAYAEMIVVCQCYSLIISSYGEMSCQRCFRFRLRRCGFLPIRPLWRQFQLCTQHATRKTQRVTTATRAKKVSKLPRHACFISDSSIEPNNHKSKGNTCK